MDQKTTGRHWSVTSHKGSMSEIAISSENWLAISLRNGAALVFNLNKADQWQSLQAQTVPSEKKSADDDDENSNEVELNRNLIRFSPNGQRLAINGQNKQIFIYIRCDDLTEKTFWKLQRMISMKKRASAFDFSDEFLLIADKSGDVYKVDLTSTTDQTEITLTADDCLMGHLSMLLDISFVRTIDDQPLILTADRDEKIRLSRYPNAYHIEGFCLGHTEFVLQVKPIDQRSILSASGDGTLRVWQIPECLELKRYETPTLITSSTRLVYPSETNAENAESNVNLSAIDASIYKMDLFRSSSSSTVYVALSIYASRQQSIYLLRLSDDQCYQISFDSNFGTILDYSFPTSTSTDVQLIVLFDSNRLIRLDVRTIFEEKSIRSEEDPFPSINNVLQQKDYHPINNSLSKMMMFNQLFKKRGQPGDSSYYKRKNERIEQEEAKRKRKEAMRQVQSPDQ